MSLDLTIILTLTQTLTLTLTQCASGMSHEVPLTGNGDVFSYEDVDQARYLVITPPLPTHDVDQALHPTPKP